MENLKKQIIYWTSFSFEQWHIILAATTDGLCYVGSFEQFKIWSSKTSLKNFLLEQNDEQLLPYSEQFKEYFQGKRVLTDKQGKQLLPYIQRYNYVDFSVLKIDPNESAVYIVNNSEIGYFDPSKFDIRKFDYYSAIIPKSLKN